ncbi:MAG: 4'-phosphopantetheinyl transferase superfamily protein [Pirellulales bacterium]
MGCSSIIPPMHIDWPKVASPPELAADEVHVWAIALEASDAAIVACGALLSGEERQRAERFYFDHLRRRFTVGHGALRQILAHYIQVAPAAIEFTTLAGGKPALAESHATDGLTFNLTHSGELALVAVARTCEVGVDVERLREVSNVERLARRYFHPHEVENVLAETSAQQQHAAFLRCWTGKEAVVKAYGTGLVAGLQSFRVPVIRAEDGWADLSSMPQPFAESQCWLTRLTPAEDYVAACACIGERRRMTCLSLET